jgi:hypothetical protein
MCSCFLIYIRHMFHQVLLYFIIAELKYHITCAFVLHFGCVIVGSTGCYCCLIFSVICVGIVAAPFIQNWC